mmetsp:Transcript_29240/g.47763  ORF Transcript_29240/g.47763 Transcript_29240/m.47763 type:complete len:210 (+) Transcript_29240:187-816(+)
MSAKLRNLFGDHINHVLYFLHAFIGFQCRECQNIARRRLQFDLDDKIVSAELESFFECFFNRQNALLRKTCALNRAANAHHLLLQAFLNDLEQDIVNRFGHIVLRQKRFSVLHGSLQSIVRMVVALRHGPHEPPIQLFHAESAVLGHMPQNTVHRFRFVPSVLCLLQIIGRHAFLGQINVAFFFIDTQHGHNLLSSHANQSIDTAYASP